VGDLHEGVRASSTGKKAPWGTDNMIDGPPGIFLLLAMQFMSYALLLEAKL
jgi:hypothetical protein